MKRYLPPTGSHADLIARFARAVEALLPDADRLASDEFTAEERDEVRRLAGMYTIFNLKNRLVALCGERARRMTAQGNLSL